MTITKRQFTQLQAMGIALWQSKAPVSASSPAEFLSFNFDELCQTKIFNDIITSLGLSLGEINYQQNALSLGLLTWKFSEQNDILLTKQQLITPSIDVLTNSPQLKKALWLQLQEHITI